MNGAPSSDLSCAQCDELLNYSQSMQTYLNRWVFSPPANSLRLMDGDQRCSGREYQMTGGSENQNLSWPLTYFLAKLLRSWITYYILHAFLPPRSTALQRYSLRRRTHTHSFQLLKHCTCLSHCIFLTLMLYQNCYLFSVRILSTVVHCLLACVLSCLL